MSHNQCEKHQSMLLIEKVIALLHLHITPTAKLTSYCTSYIHFIAPEVL